MTLLQKFPGFWIAGNIHFSAIMPPCGVKKSRNAIIMTPLAGLKNPVRDDIIAAMTLPKKTIQNPVRDDIIIAMILPKNNPKSRKG